MSRVYYLATKRVGAAIIVLLLLAQTAMADTRLRYKNGIRLDNRDQEWRLQLNGRLHVDTANYDDSGTALRNGSEVRRARLSLSSRYKDDFRFRGDYEFSDIGTGIKNLFVQYRGLDRWRLTVGHQIAPFGMEQQQSSNRLDLMERSLLQALTPAFHLGVGAQYRADRWFARFGVFDRNLDDAEARRARGKAFTGRIAGTPFRGDQWHTHIGASVEYRELDNDSLRFATRPESFVADTRLINTRTIDAAEQLATYGLEATASVGRCRAGGEYIVSHTSRTALPNLQFDGFYVQAACVLRGGNYEFRDNRGQFRPIQSRDSLGTVEVTTRLSRLDLNDKTVLGGRQTNTSIGVTWVPVESMRFLVNLVDYDASPNRNGAIDTGRLWQARLQFTF